MMDAKVVTSLAALSALLVLSIIGMGEKAFSQSSDQYSAMQVNVDGKQYSVKFIISGGASIQSMVLKEDAKTLVVTLAPSHGNGTFGIQLPRNLMDAKSNGNDISYTVSVDGAHRGFVEFEKSETARAIRVNFGSNDKEITIGGTYVVPEFLIPIFVITSFTIGMVMVAVRFNIFRKTI